MHRNLCLTFRGGGEGAGLQYSMYFIWFPKASFLVVLPNSENDATLQKLVTCHWKVTHWTLIDLNSEHVEKKPFFHPVFLSFPNQHKSGEDGKRSPKHTRLGRKKLNECRLPRLKEKEKSFVSGISRVGDNCSLRNSENGRVAWMLPLKSV